ncbi:septal ring lytic transglycosylase RlpA family protein [Granulicella sp. WH15]|nr:septal ring lytic transglycosylase RlpA family protein [Granulicella sp. WH15]
MQCLTWDFPNRDNEEVMTDLKQIETNLTKQSGPSRLLARAAVLSTIVGLSLSAVASDRVESKAATTSPTQESPQSIPSRWFQIGKASWYGFRFQGHKTANGEKFDMNSLTCAHRSLPLGSWIRVTNLHTRKSIFVRVNDRGPIGGNRIVDLSYAAARAVGLAGVSKVKLEAVREGDPEMAKALIAQLHMPPELLSR